jgi:glycosyltransferase involved in cell wall biosynthesis
MQPAAPQTYLFRFNTELESTLFGGEAELSGWLLHREGKPIHGIRAVTRGRVIKARRKRSRPDVAAAFPQFPDAEFSGFLLELRLPFGRNRIEFQVLDHERKWRTFARASTFAVPFTRLRRLGLTNLRRFLIFYFRRHKPLQVEVTHDESRPISAQRVDLFATSRSNLFIIEIGELVAAGFRELGHEARLRLDDTPDASPADETLQIVVTPHEYYGLFLREKLGEERARELTRSVYLLCTEQPETGWFEGNVQWGRYSLGVADINPLGVTAYRARGLPARQLHLGYHPILEERGGTAHAERKIDVTFLGSMTPRREQFFARHADFFAEHRCHLRLVPLEFAKTEATRSYLSPERRNELLSDSRVLLNVHYSEQKYFEWHRMLLGLANGCCIITETSHGYGALVPGKHFIMVEPEHLATACEYYLAHADECEAIARAGSEFVRASLRQSQMCQAFLEGITDPSGDEPLAELSAGLKHAISHETRRLFFDSVRRDLRRTSAAREQSAQDDVAEKREGYKARLQAQEEMRARGEAIFQLYDNEAFARSVEPRLSVVVTLFNYRRYIEECIDSVSRAAERLRAPFEVVIVNDASTDDSLAAARACQEKSALPIRIVDKRYNTGLADARNTGIQISRAPYIFMLDADNLVFPEALRQLLETISAEDYDAAYSLLCRFKDEPSNRIALLSYFDWDPEVLVQYPYVDAMAMFRRETLLSLGGYDNQLSQIGWFGWEDYDMWLKYVKHDCRVAFVPNTLCLYRVHERSMINTTTRFEGEMVQHFLSHYGELLERYPPRGEKIFGIPREKIPRLEKRHAGLKQSAKGAHQFQPGATPQE